MPASSFRSSTQLAVPPDVSAPLKAMWWAAKGDWDRAHAIVQDEETADAAWVHAYLHRVEGDLSNARYWYNRATRTPANCSLPDEWDSIVAELLLKNSKT